MSYEIGCKAIRLEPTPRVAHTEYCDHRTLIERVTGKGSDWNTAAFNDAWDIDFQWNTNDGPIDWAKVGRVTDMGHAEFVDGGSDLRSGHPSPFTDPEQVLDFDATREYGLYDFERLVQSYEACYRSARAAFPHQLVTGGYYKTLISGAIHSFGWDMLLMAAADQERFETVLDSFFRLTLHHVKAWARTSIDVFIQHDDMVWSQGAFLHPEFYRRAIFPRYAELWQVLHKAGKKVIFCSDACWDEFTDDIVKAGADGFIFEPMMKLEPIVEKYGQTHAIFTSQSDCRTLAFGTRAQIQAEIDSTLALALKCPGFFYAVGNHMPANIPIENALFYIDYLRAHWARTAGSKC